MYLIASSWLLAQQLVAFLEVSRGSIPVLRILVVVILILLSAFFASAEIAIFSLGDHRLRMLIDDGSPGVETLAALKSDPCRVLVTILIGNNSILIRF